MSSVLLVVSVLGIVCSSTAVSITRCRAEDSACLKQSAQAFVPILAVGIPEYGAKSLDPLHIPTIDASGKSDFKMIVNGVVVRGMKDCTIPDISRNAATHKLHVDVLCDVDVQGEYTIKGRIFNLPIDGSGHLIVKLYKILISVNSQLKDVEKNGKKYWNVEHWEYNWILKDRATIDLKDLFAGDHALTKSMRELAEESSTDIVKQVGEPIVTAITSEVVDAIKHLYSHVPADELALN